MMRIFFGENDADLYTKYVHDIVLGDREQISFFILFYFLYYNIWIWRDLRLMRWYTPLFAA
jgi:hypothetical protein